LWVDEDFSTSDSVPCDYKLDSKASKEYQIYSGCTDAIPLEESTGREGSDCGHWAEDCFVDELMTPAYDDGAPNPISRVTVATLDDLGYQVNYKGADEYTTFSDDCKCGFFNRADANTTMTTKTKVDETRHNRSLLDPDHPDAFAIAKAKEILTAMINEAPGPDDAPPVSGDVIIPTTNFWVNMVTSNVNSGTVQSYILTPRNLNLV
jgi:hypothetical protein